MLLYTNAKTGHSDSGCKPTIYKWNIDQKYIHKILKYCSTNKYWIKYWTTEGLCRISSLWQTTDVYAGTTDEQPGTTD